MLCPASPSLQWIPWVSVLHLHGLPKYFGHRYYDPLRLPFLLLGSLRFRLASRYLACSLLTSCSRRLIDLAENYLINARCICIPVHLKPVSFSKEMTALSSSQAIPLNTCPAHRSRWCLGSLPVASNTIAFRPFKNVGFCWSKPAYPFRPQLYNFRDSITRPTFLFPSARYTPYWLCTRGALLSRWPNLLRQDLNFHSHLLANNNHFHRLLPNSMTLGLA